MNENGKILDRALRHEKYDNIRSVILGLLIGIGIVSFPWVLWWLGWYQTAIYSFMAQMVFFTISMIWMKMQTKRRK